MNDQEVRDEIKRRQEAAGPGVAINISDLVAARMKAPEGFTMKLVSPEEAKVSVRTVHIDILCKVSSKGFNFSENQTKRFREWLEKQSRLFDGCIEFGFCPHSMGISTWVTNSLTNDRCDLTEY